ncbi:MAG: hypothetical protein HY735_12825 [Verrucomicrobia bacterium]|nr:hypothetical protein [Verrucomicrobiota bacterium]
MLRPTGLWPKTFKQAYCEKFHCLEEAYEKEVFWRCLYRHALPFAASIYRKKPEFFREDFDLIREVGNMEDADTFRSEINFYYGRNIRERNWLRRKLCIRLSAKRLMKLKNDVFRTPLLTAVLLR